MMKSRRRNSAAYSIPFPLKGVPAVSSVSSVYNIFPEIKEPLRRAYYLPIVDAVFLPRFHSADPSRFEQELGKDIDSALWHEIAHAVVADTVVTCKQRELALRLLAQTLSMVAEGEAGYRLLVPSFVVVQPDGTREYQLANMADELDGLLGATSLIHEVAAGALQAELLGLEEAEAKQHIRSSVGDAAENSMLSDSLLDDVLAICEHVSAIGFSLLVSGTLNSPDVIHLSQGEMLDRFQRMVQISATYLQSQGRDITLQSDEEQEDLPQPIALYFKLMTACDAVMKHLDREMPGCRLGGCPLDGNPNRCLSKNLRKEARRMDKDSLVGSLLLMGARLMHQLRCSGPNQELIPESFISSATEELNTNIDSEVEMLLSPTTYKAEAAWPTMYLSLCRTALGSCRVEFDTINQKQPQVGVEEGLQASLLFHALWQQLWTGEGPKCLCHPDQQPNCLLSMVLSRLWEHSEADPGWETNWKQHRPGCI